YHFAFDDGGRQAVYAFMGDHALGGAATGPACGTTPGGRVATEPDDDVTADAQVSVTAHELAESVTDPTGGGWAGGAGGGRGRERGFPAFGGAPAWGGPGPAPACGTTPGGRVATEPDDDVTADAQVSVTAHELAESVTDPTGGGWAGGAGGGEIGDKCANRSS